MSRYSASCHDLEVSRPERTDETAGSEAMGPPLMPMTDSRATSGASVRAGRGTTHGQSAGTPRLERGVDDIASTCARGLGHARRHGHPPPNRLVSQFDNRRWLAMAPDGPAPGSVDALKWRSDLDRLLQPPGQEPRRTRIRHGRPSGS